MRNPRSRPGSAHKGKAADGGSGVATRRNRTRSNERIVAIYSSANRDLASRCRGDAGWFPRLLVASGFGLAAGRLPHDPGNHATTWRQSGYDRVTGNRSAGAAVWADPGIADDDIVELLRHQPGDVAVRSQSRHRRRRSGCAIGDQCRSLDIATQPALPTALLEGEPG